MKSPQDLIEEELLRLCADGEFEALMLFNEEGIPMAEVGNAVHYNKDALGALSVLLQQSAELIKDFHSETLVNETAIRTTSKFRIVSRSFVVENLKLILVAIVPQNRPYRDITNKAVYTIQQLLTSTT